MVYKIKKSRRAGRLRITVRRNGEILVTVPWLMSVRKARKFVEEKNDWIEKSLKKIKINDNSDLLGKGNRKDYLENKKVARGLVELKLKKFNKIYNFKYNRIAIRDQRTRWGSCSSKKNLNFNYRIVFLSEEMADYLIVHELCHLGEMNHSRKFWELIEKAIPDSRRVAKELRRL